MDHMSWLALIDQTDARFDPTGLSPRKRQSPKILARGTFMVEADAQCLSDDCDLIRHTGPGRGISLRAHRGRGLSLCTGAGTVFLPPHEAVQGETMRLTFTWNLPAGTAHVHQEWSSLNKVHTVDAPLPAPMKLDNVRDVTIGESTEIDRRIDYVGISSRVEPLGPYPTLVGQSRVMTDTGMTPVSRLKRGDLVRTDFGELTPVLHNISMTLPARGRFAPLRLMAPALGLREDVLVGADQCLLLRGSEIEYTFGSEAALLPARHLLGTPAARLASCGSVVTYHQLILPRNEGLLAGQTALASMNIGRIRRNDDALNLSVLRDIDRNLLPEHVPGKFPVLSGLDALALLEQRAA
jgi:hypothetical protein